MAGFIPAIHLFLARFQDVDARDKRGHDGHPDIAGHFPAVFSDDTIAPVALS